MAEGVVQLDGGKKERRCGEAWEVWEWLNKGDTGQIVMVLALDVARNEGGMGIWATTKGSLCPEMSMMPIFW